MSYSNPFRILMLLLAASVCGGARAQGPYGAPVYQQPPQLNVHMGEAVPDIWDESQPLERFFAAVAKRSRVRIEYLHWDFEEPDPGNLGAPITDVPDPSIPFLVNDNLNNAGAPAGFAVVPNAADLGLQDISGIRGTLEVDLAVGTIEASVFGTQADGASLIRDDLQRGRPLDAMGMPVDPELGTILRPNVITPLLTNGAPTTAENLNALIYDEGFEANIALRAWGTGVIFLQEKYLPREAFNWQWLGGARYLNIEEDFVQVGRFNNGGANLVSSIFTVGGEGLNNIYGPEFGGRASMQSDFVSVNITPKLMMGLNDHRSQVFGSVATGAAVESLNSFEEAIDFTAVFDLNVQVEFHLTPHCSVFAGYDFLYIGQTSRPNQNIVYDSTPNAIGSFDPTVTNRTVLDDFSIQGFNLGGKLTY